MPEPAWKRRFLAPTISTPSWARDDPDRCVYVSNVTGTSELYTWDRRMGTHQQATKRPEGTMSGTLTPEGDALWWFDDTKGNEKGRWRTQPFGDGPGDAAPTAASIDPGYPTGIALASGGRAAIGLAGEGRHRIYAVVPGEATVVLHDHHEASGVGGWSRDEMLLSFSHAEHGDNRNRALRVVTADGTRVGDLWDGTGLGVASFSWSDVDGDQRLLIAHERRGSRHPALWSPVDGSVVDLDVDLGDHELIGADWYPDAAAVLLWTIGRGRGQLLRHELVTGASEVVPTTPGMITGARVRPDGEVWWSGSDAATPPVVHCGKEILRPPGEVAPGGVPYEDVLVEGPGGAVHGFVARPSTGDGPFPAVFRIHGGPAGVDTDAFTAPVQAWVDHGFAVVMVNYRGSVGYGKAWADAIVGKPGYRELEDIAAVREAVVRAGIADPDRLVLHGGSWGGYLTLLGVGTQPDLWSLGVSGVPLASLRDHYWQQGEVLQAYWRTLFGGTPDTLGSDLDEIDPIASVGRIRVPVFVLVGDNDPRCPLPQVLTYVEELAAAGVDHELYRYDAGHGSMVVEEQIDQLSRCIDFVARHLNTLPPHVWEG
ncbi:MAG: prolyl oligopeptidase family serine peptidase [Actinomycetota bacterium]|nr:prolyl oligopeptidase family serine peptidase [Actinomycetota bacterium]